MFVCACVCASMSATSVYLCVCNCVSQCHTLLQQCTFVCARPPLCASVPRLLCVTVSVNVCVCMRFSVFIRLSSLLMDGSAFSLTSITVCSHPIIQAHSCVSATLCSTAINMARSPFLRSHLLTALQEVSIAPASSAVSFPAHCFHAVHSAFGVTAGSQTNWHRLV